MKKRAILWLVLILLVTGCNKDVIEESELKKGLENFIQSGYNFEQFEASLEDGKIKVRSEDEKDYIFNYNLKKEPTFTYELKIEKGISYGDYVLETDMLFLPFLGYVASAYTYGVNAGDAFTYFTSAYIKNTFNIYNESKYVVLYDDDEIETDAEIILVSEFGDKVIDYVKDVYNKDIKISDEENGTYTYELTSDCSTDTCTLTSKLTVNSEADFTKINGYLDEVAKKNMYEDITPETADYNIELKVGQTIEIRGKNLNGYELAGVDIVDVEGQFNFTGTREGIANGYLYIGEDDFRTIYVTVEKKQADEKLQNKTLNIK